jgi:hypothetical protein
MQVAGTKSWAMATDEPSMLLFALHVRDASGLRPQSEPQVPELEPAVLGPVGAPPDVLTASKQWDAWWKQLLDGGGFWPEHVDPRDFGTIRRDPAVAKLYYWPAQFALPDYPGLDGSPELQSLARAQHAAALAWAAARKLEWEALETSRSRAGLEGRIVRDIERTLGRPARPFRLDLRLLPVAAAYVWRTSKDRALMSLRMYRDRAGYESWLTEIVRELA